MRFTDFFSLQLSAKSVGLFEAFYNSLKPIQVRLDSPKRNVAAGESHVGSAKAWQAASWYARQFSINIDLQGALRSLLSFP